MVGFYPNVPAPKLALDKDGTQWTWWNGAGAGTPLTSTQINNMTGAYMAVPHSSWQVGGANSNDGFLTLSVTFPEKRDIYGVFTAGTMLNSVGQSPPNVVWEYSLNTTNGQDGTWSNLHAAYQVGYYVVPNYRTEIKTVAATNVRGVRIRQTSGSWSMNFSALHLYGYTTAGENPHKLALWHPTLDEEVSPTWFDWGDVPRNSNATKTFRVKNLSPTLTANTSRVALSANVDTASPTNLSQFTLSTDGSTWLSQINLGSPTPGTISSVITIKRDTLTTAKPGLWMARVFAEATSWS